MNIDKLDRLATVEELKAVNNDLSKIYEELTKQTRDLEKPSGIADRVFVDIFGVFAMYLLLFFACDITRSVVLDEDMFGIKWLFFGPYYFFTGAPLMTRLWKSKKFLEDLSDVKRGGYHFDIETTCTDAGNKYKLACEIEERNPRKHPIRDNLGMGLDWLLRHTVGKHFGGLLGNATCQDQAKTIAADCAWDRTLALWGAYNGFCDLYPDQITRRAEDINWPNTVSMSSGYISQFSDIEKAAYQMYYEGYTKIYDIGSKVFTGHGTPENLITTYDNYTYYCYNANKMWGLNNFTPPNSYAYLGLHPPPWYAPMLHDTSDYEYNMRLFQENYQQHMLDV